MRYVFLPALILGLFTLNGCDALNKAEEDSDAAARSFAISQLLSATGCNTDKTNPTELTSGTAVSGQVGVTGICYYQLTTAGTYDLTVTAGSVPSGSQVIMWLSNDGVSNPSDPGINCVSGISPWFTCATTPTSGLTTTVTSSRIIAIYGRNSSGNAFTLTATRQ